MSNGIEAVKTAIESGDYQTWLEAVGVDSPMAQEVTAEEFPRLIEAHGLMEQAREKMEAAQQIREEIGLPGRMGKGPGVPGEFGRRFKNKSSGLGQ